MSDAYEIALVGGGEVARTPFFGVSSMDLEEFVVSAAFEIAQKKASKAWEAFATDDDVLGLDAAFFGGALDGVDEEVAAFLVIFDVERNANLIA